MKLVIFFLSLFIIGCSSTPEAPTTDVCSLKKHWKDNIFQVRINDVPINTHWYIYPEAKGITRELAKRNKCKS